MKICFDEDDIVVICEWIENKKDTLTKTQEKRSKWAS